MAGSKVTVEMNSGERFSATLMMQSGASPKGAITDGTSNTIMFSEGQSMKLQSGFGLLLPAVAGSKFQAGAALSSFNLLPYVEQENLRRQSGANKGWKVQGGRVTKVSSAADGGVMVWLQPQGIIAILIGL